MGRTEVPRNRVIEKQSSVSSRANRARFFKMEAVEMMNICQTGAARLPRVQVSCTRCVIYPCTPSTRCTRRVNHYPEIHVCFFYARIHIQTGSFPDARGLTVCAIPLVEIEMEG